MSRQPSLLGRLLRSPTLYLIVALLVLAAGISIALRRYPIDEIRAMAGPATIAITLPLHIVLAMTPFPADLFAIANGALYGLAVGTAWSCLGWWVAGFLQFALGRRARKDLDLGSQTEKLPAWLRRFPVNHPVYLIGIRQVPWLGMHLGSFVPGTAGVSVGRYTWCSAIGVVPGSLVMTAVGAGIVHFT